jgi:hypothetical protein
MYNTLILTFICCSRPRMHFSLIRVLFVYDKNFLSCVVCSSRQFISATYCVANLLTVFPARMAKNFGL